MLYRLGSPLGVLSMVAGCAQKAGDRSFPSGDRAVAVIDNMGDDRLGVANRVRLTVCKEPGVRGEYFVNPDGLISRVVSSRFVHEAGV